VQVILSRSGRGELLGLGLENGQPELVGLEDVSRLAEAGDGIPDIDARSQAHRREVVQREGDVRVVVRQRLAEDGQPVVVAGLRRRVLPQVALYNPQVDQAEGGAAAAGSPGRPGSRP
jgi:hypothetical protein